MYVYIQCYSMYMPRRTTIELDEELLHRAKRALGLTGTRATVEEALRRAADQAEGDRRRRRADQLRYLEQMPEHVDLEVLISEEMWR
jgi:Arc/MetJ family transcription regulator